MVGVLGVVSGGTCWDVLWWEWWEVGGDLRCCNFVIIMFDHFYRISRLYLTRTLRAKVLYFVPRPVVCWLMIWACLPSEFWYPIRDTRSIALVRSVGTAFGPGQF